MPTIGGLMNYGNAEAAKFSINGVSWFQTEKFCKRLPTSTEWELAARGTDGRTYPWGFEEPDCSRTVMDRENACSHDGGDLSEGEINGSEITCPRHGARFCLKTGEVLCAPAFEDIEAYPIRVVDGRIKIAINTDLG